jgi:type IV pilus assembly protein PilM
VGDSIWKKELSFKRKPKPDDDPDFDLERPEPTKQSFLKKEISFSRKRRDPAPTADPEAEAKRESIWKKEIGFGKKQDRTVEELMEQAAAAVLPEPFDPQPVAPPHPVELAESVVAAMPDPTAPAPVADLHPVEELPVDTPVAEAVPGPPMPPSPPLPGMPAPPAPPAPVEAVTPAVEHVAAWTTPEPAAPAPEPVEAWPTAEPAAPAAEPWLADAELPPAPEAPQPVVVHPPVPAADLPDVAAPKQSFLKKELSFRRKPRPASDPDFDLEAPKQSFLKKDLSFSRKPKAPKEPSSGQPFWKKDLSFSRKPKPDAEAPTVQLPAVQAPPPWKRDVKLPLPKLSLPRLKRKGTPHSTKRLVGLKIGASQLAAARVTNNGVAELEQLARDPLAAGIVVQGEPRDPEALGDALKAFFARHKLPRKGVRLGIASNRIGVRVIEIVGVDEDKQLANAVQFRAQEALPIPLDEAVLDYRVLGETVDAEGQVTKRVLLVVAYRELVDRYISACQKAGLTLAGIDLEAFALLRALGAPADRGGSALVAVSIGHDRSTFAVSDGRNCEFTRVVDWGGSALNVALARAFDSTPSEVEQIKRGISLDGSTTPEGLNAEQAAVALDAVRRQVQSFARELVSSLQFYQGQPGSLGIGEIVLTGGTAELPGLAEELGRLIGVTVRIGDPLARLKIAKRVGLNEPMGSLAVAIGLGIED